MSTIYSTMNIPREPEMPGWMREERYMFCDQSTTNQAHKNSNFWKKLKKVFS